MRKYYFIITSILFLVVGLASCSDEESKTQNETALRPSVPIMANEVQIGNQIWMTKNLNVSRYRNGDLIPQVTTQLDWINLTTGAWCYYSNNTVNGIVYGKLYNWYAVNDPRGLAPVGWHVPNETDLNTLVIYLGGTGVAGGKLKSISGWLPPNYGATNSTGFTALPGGIRLNYATINNNFGDLFENNGEYGNWWLSTASNASSAKSFFINYTTDNVAISQNNHAYGFSVRCIKD